ncbi:hypothetical protein GGQ80_002360 [Sphingomonas jinjuensis]|uniref:Uncharacterized protein n=1 Tax=Sphingomonas jinjuensis TaxID=535907 RepID=A0A840FFN0_9SPHN|nr:hypothetical protein [Sphingomonas jinjuensis]MBB4154447.1 hypothetical protein [Sphingomonas jinjuensis]
MVLATFLLTMPQPIMPGMGLDNGWILAAEYAARHGAQFGHDFVFTYGPLAVLSTHLFDSATYGWVMAADLLLMGLWLAPLILSRRPVVIAAYGVALLLAPYGPDARLTGALFAAVVVALARPGYWIAAVAAFFAPLALAKYSFALAALPLLILVDLYYFAVLHRLPVALLSFLAMLAISLLLTGQAASGWLSGAAAVGQVIGGYSAAMSIEPGIASYGAMAAILVTLLLVFAMTGWTLAKRRLDARGLFGLGALAWTSFIAFKMGYVRADAHTVITWSAVALLLPALAADLDSRRRLGRPEAARLIGLCVLTALGTMLFAIKFDAIDPPKVALTKRVSVWTAAPSRSLVLFTPNGWQSFADQRAAALRSLARRFPAAVTGSVDVIPYDIAPVIASGLDYRPRPVLQSYSSYTAPLQRNDALFFATPTRAPQTLLLAIGTDIDHRLPTLATGPSLPVIAAGYDIVGRHPLGLVLRRRTTPRGAVTAAAGSADFATNTWVNLPPHRSDQMVLAAIDLDRTLVARLGSLAVREPIVFIELRFADGRSAHYRFISGMAQVGTVLSPMSRSALLADLDAAEGTLLPGTRPAAAGDVAAFRIVADGVTRIAYPRGRATFSTVSLAQ